jgi:hypothetical protein
MVLSIVVLRGMLPAIAPWLLLRLALGSLVGLPLGLVAFRYAEAILDAMAQHGSSSAASEPG